MPNRMEKEISTLLAMIQNPSTNMRDCRARESVTGFVESEVEGGGAFRQLAPELKILLAGVPLVLGGGDMQDVSLSLFVTVILVPVLGDSAANGDHAANLLGMGKAEAIVEGTRLRESQQEDSRGVSVMLPRGEFDHSKQVVMMNGD